MHPQMTNIQASAQDAFEHIFNWLRVFRNVEASRCGHGIRQARQTQAVQ